MPLFHIVILALIQGITEFLPVSSSGHLVLAHQALGHNGGWHSDMMIDVAVHVGTLGAALLYFRADIKAMACGILCPKHAGQGRALFVKIVLASLPVIAAGLVMHITAPDWTRNLYVMAWCTLIFGVVLYLADKTRPAQKDLTALGWKEALMIGFAQILSLVPGVSRSGITMTAARFLGFTRTDAARFSLLLAIVAISGAGTLSGLDLWRAQNTALGLDALLAALFAFISGYAAIVLMMKWLLKASFTPFVVYRFILGIVLLTALYGGFIEP